MRGTLNALAVLAALSAGAAFPASAADVPLPDKIEYLAPAADVPDSFRKFIGRWEGRWGTELDHIFIVTSVSASGAAEAIYAYGDAPKWQVQKDWHRVKGTIAGNKLELPRFPNSAEVNYTLQGDGSLKGEYWINRNVTYGMLKKQ